MPVLIFACLMLIREQQQDYRATEAEARAMALATATAVDARVSQELSVLQVLAERRELAGGDAAAWGLLPLEAYATLSRWRGLALVDGNGRILAKAASAAAARLPLALEDPEVTTAALRTGRPAVSGVKIDLGMQYVILGVPAPGPERERPSLALVAVLPLGVINANLREQPLAPGWRSTVVDGLGRIIARTLSANGQDPVLGLVAPPPFDRARPGAVRAPGLDGVELFAIAAASRVTGWTVWVAAPADLALRPLREAASLLWSGAAIALLASAALGATLLSCRASHVAATRDLAVERALREGDRRYRLLAEALPQPMWTTRPDGTKEYVNPSWTECFGGEASEDRRCGGTVHPDDRQQTLALWHRSLETGEPHLVEHRLRVADGSYRWFRTRAVPLLEENEAITRWLGISLDIDDERQATQALARHGEWLERQVTERTAALATSEARFRAFFENAPDMVFLARVELDGSVVYEAVNPSVEKLTQRPAADFIGHRVEEVWPGDFGKKLVERYRACAASGRLLRYETDSLMGSGVRLAEAIMVPLHSNGSSAVRVMVTSRDVSERRELERKLAQAQKMEAVGQLTGGVAHDFNNLLQAVAGSLELARTALDRDETSRVARLLDTANRSIERGARLTGQLLAFSRRQILRAECVTANQVVADMDDLIRRGAGETIALTISAARDPWLCLLDPAQFQSALLNLVLNARDAMPAGGALTIALANVSMTQPQARQLDLPAGDYVRVQVHDSGIGMPPEVLARGFEPFYSTTGVGTGSGLGLAQVHGFVRQSGGAVRIESAAGQGTTVSLFFPRAGAAAPPRRAAAQWMPATPEATGQVVLLVEDEPTVLEVAQAMLVDAGFRVIPASDAGDALTALHSGAAIDALVCDVVLPGGASGFDIAREACRIRPGLRAILVSGYAADVLARLGGDSGFELLAKPYTRDDLVRLVTGRAASLRQVAGRATAP